MKHQKAKRIFSVCLILALALLIGIFSNRLWTAIDENSHPLAYWESVETYSERYGVPQEIIYAVIKTESGFEPKAESSKGARGLMQMTEPTFAEMTGPLYLNENLGFDALLTPDVSIRYGTYYLKYLYDMFGQNWNCALAAYNGGLGNVRKWLKDPQYSDLQGNLTYIPFEETRNYVEKVEQAREMYLKLYFTPEQGANT